jgi:NSS family neurotransmitter:Na+ symporter
MNIRESSYGSWSSTRAFIWVAGGAAMGMGGVLRLPYLAAQYGGLAFWLVYLLALLLLGLPLLVAELMLGRWTREDLISGLAHLSRASDARRAWAWIGGLALVCGALILSYYSVIAGWFVAYTLRAAGGWLNGASPSLAVDLFYALAQDPERSLAWHTIFMATVGVIVAYGIRGGIERAAIYLVPFGVLVAAGLFALALVDERAPQALEKLFALRLNELGWRGVLEALHQAFYTLGLGLGVMFAYGSYLPARTSLVRVALAVIALDACYGVLAGAALFVLLGTADLSAGQGVTQLFLLLPTALSPDFSGLLLGVMIYLMLFAVTLMSAVALLEPPTRFLMDRYRHTRVFAAGYSAMLIWCLGLATLLSFSLIREWRWMGQTVFDLLQWITGRLLVPVSVLLTCTFIVRVVSADIARIGWGERDKFLFGPWRQLLRYPVRLSLLMVLALSVGLVDWLVSLWS